jgi:hypothetical protein
VGPVIGRGAVMKAAVGQGPAEALVKEEKEQGDVNAFGGEAVGIAFPGPFQ